MTFYGQVILSVLADGSISGTVNPGPFIVNLSGTSSASSINLSYSIPSMPANGTLVLTK